MGIPDDDPFGFVHIGLPLSLIEGLLFSSLNHVTYVNGMGEQILQDLRVPGYTLIFFRFYLSGLIEICCRGRDAGFIEPAANLDNADALGAPLEYPANRGGCFFIDDKVVLVIGVFAVSIRCPRPDELAALLLYMKCGSGFLGYILAVNLVDEIF